MVQETDDERESPRPASGEQRETDTGLDERPATEREIEINSHRTGLAEIEPGDHIVFGEDADYPNEEWVVLSIERVHDPNPGVGVVTARIGDAEQRRWTESQVQGAVETNDTHVERDGELIA